MTKKVKPVPDGCRTLTPYLTVRDAASAIEFYKRAFGAEETSRMPGPHGRIVYAELRLGDSGLMLADEFPEMGSRGPHSYGGSPVALMLYVNDVDAVVARAVSAGAKVTRAVADRFYGDRNGAIEDPFGHTWFVATHVEDVPADEIERRATQMATGAV